MQTVMNTVTTTMMAAMAAIGIVAAGVVPARTAADPQTRTVQECNHNQQTMNVCAQQRYASADAALNRSYRRNIGVQPDYAARTRLRKAQRSWIVYRDKDCAVEARPREESSSI